MKFIIDVLKLGLVINFFNFITNLFKQLWNLLAPPRAFSAQTLILLSIFSYVTAYLVTNPFQDFIANIGWIFLIFGVSWFTSDNPPLIYNFSLGPWITGALVCIFVFGTWRGEFIPATLICWPPTSAVLASVREFFDVGLKFKMPLPVARQNVVILLLTNLLISCWLMFTFTIQDWLDKYPTLLADDFSASAFVVKIENPQMVMSRGTLILNSIEPLLKQEISNKPWSQVERWLLPQKREARMENLTQQVQKQLPQAAEDKWWRFEYKVSSIKSGYNLQLRAIWQGPRSSESGDYSIKKSCQITQTYKQSRGNLTPISKVKCQD